MSTGIPDTDWMELPIDSHGTPILDIDRDGLLDIYIATGGGMGLESGPAMNAVVLWGEPSAASVNGVDQVFRGGRETTELFDLHNADSLDMVLSNDSSGRYKRLRIRSHQHRNDATLRACGSHFHEGRLG